MIIVNKYYDFLLSKFSIKMELFNIVFNIGIYLTRTVYSCKISCLNEGDSVWLK